MGFTFHIVLTARNVDSLLQEGIAACNAERPNLVFQLQQVSKVLNAHMDALSWVQHNSGEFLAARQWAFVTLNFHAGLLQKQLQELERTCQQQRRDQDQLLRR